jgi:hypothetical protein
MKSPIQRNAKAFGSRIEFSRSLGRTQDEANWLNSVAGIHNFRAPWAPVRSSDAGGSSSDMAQIVPGVRPEDPQTESSDQSIQASIVPFEIVCEEIRRRTETKTTILELALQRTESFQPRFWGINE